MRINKRAVMKVVASLLGLSAVMGAAWWLDDWF